MAEEIFNINYWKQFDIKSEHYMNRYIKFIESIQNKGERQLDYCEKHHIIPRSFIENNSIIKLTAREHFIAHHILARALGGKMVFAFLRMCYPTKNANYKVTPRIYEEVKLMDRNEKLGKHHSEESKQKMSKSRKGMFSGKNNPMYGKGYLLKGRKVSDETKKRLSECFKIRFSGKNNPMYGKFHSQEARKKMSINHYDCSGENNPNYNAKSFTQESIEKIREAKIGKIKVYNDKKILFINKEDLGKYLSMGFKRGQGYSSNSCSGKICINNSIRNKYILKEDLNQYLSKGWKLGSKRIGNGKGKWKTEKMEVIS